MAIVIKWTTSIFEKFSRATKELIRHKEWVGPHWQKVVWGMGGGGGGWGYPALRPKTPAMG